MFHGNSRGSYQTRGRGSRGGGSTTRQKGAFIDGAWLCDCNPRLAAKYLQVKKEGPTKGRHFYTCQKDQGAPDHCKFFLWEKDAKVREEAAVLSDSRNELRSSQNVTPSKSVHVLPQSSSRMVSPPPAYTIVERDESPTKRAQLKFQRHEGEESFPWPLTGEEEAQFSRLADTPSKAAKTNIFNTPGKRNYADIAEALDDMGGLPTPITGHRNRDDVNYPKLSATPSTEGSRRSLFVSPNMTPTPARFRDASSEPEEDQLAADVFNVLRKEHISIGKEASTALTEVLGKHTLKMTKIVKGREISRLTIKAKDAKIAEMQLRVTTLEAELETQKAMVKQLKWEKENGVDADTDDEL